MRNLFVGNMSFRTTENELRAAFEEFGEIARVQIITDRDTGRPRGFGFVEMADDDAASNAIAGLNGKEVDGRAISVSEAKPKPERNGARPYGDGARRTSSFSDRGRSRDSRW